MRHHNRISKDRILCCFRVKSTGLFIGVVDLFLHLLLLMALCTAITRPAIYDYYMKHLSQEYYHDNPNAAVTTNNNNNNEANTLLKKLYLTDLSSASNVKNDNHNFISFIGSSNDYILLHNAYNFNRRM